MRTWQAFSKFARAVGLGLLLAALTPTAGHANGTFVPYQRLVMLLVGPNPSIRLPSGYGDLYSWAPGETQLLRETNYGYNGLPILSPDGTSVVFLSLPEACVKAVQRGENPTQGMGLRRPISG